MAPRRATWDGKDDQGNPLRYDTGLHWDGFIPEPPGTSKHMPHLRVSLAFTSGPDHGVEETAGAVSAGLFGNAAYPVPPVTQVALDAANKAFSDAVTAQKQGGPLATADKHNKRDILVGLLRLLASYVQMKHGDDLAVLLSSGFEAVSTTHAPAVLTAPHIREILNGSSGQLITRAEPMKNIRMFKARYAAIGAGGVPGPWQDGGLHTDSRHISINNLTPGTTYTVQLAAVIGGNQQSDWSDSVSHMSM